MSDYNFQPVTMELQQAAVEAGVRAGTVSCQYCFPNLFCLREKYGTEIATGDNGVLLVRQTRRVADCVSYLPPLGLPWAEFLNLVEAEGRPWSLFGITAEDKQHLEESVPGKLRFIEDRDWAEYLYDPVAMSVMAGPGRHLSQRRRDARICRETLGARMQSEAMTPAHYEEVRAFQRYWMEHRGEAENRPKMMTEDNENVTLREAFANFEALGLQGMVIRVDGRVAAFSYGCPVGGETFVVLAQKADSGYRHLYRIISQDFAMAYCLSYRWLNTEEDVGMTGLRQLKMTYRPKLLLEKWKAVPEAVQ